jgi:uncharacterized protein
VSSRRAYRDWVAGHGLVSYSIAIGSTDLHISTTRDLSRKALMSAFRWRQDIEGYIRTHPSFATSLEPVGISPGAPTIVREMADAASLAGVGPMAAVAGAIAGAVGRDLLACSDEVMVENGGDVFLSTKTRRVVGLYAGPSSLTGRVGLAIEPADTPLGICTSSGSFGHSLSFGAADVCVVLARSAAVADALATALCNRLHSADDLPLVLDPTTLPAEALGVLAIIDGQVGLHGAMRLVPLDTAGS